MTDQRSLDSNRLSAVFEHVQSRFDDAAQSVRLAVQALKSAGLSADASAPRCPPTHRWRADLRNFVDRLTDLTSAATLPPPELETVMVRCDALCNGLVTWNGKTGSSCMRLAMLYWESVEEAYLPLTTNEITAVEDTLEPLKNEPKHCAAFYHDVVAQVASLRPIPKSAIIEMRSALEQSYARLLHERIADDPRDIALLILNHKDESVAFGKEHPPESLPEEQFKFIVRLSEKRGVRTPGKQLGSDSTQRVDQICGRLPAWLRALIDVRPGPDGGYRLTVTVEHRMRDAHI